MAENAVKEFKQIAELFGSTDYAHYQTKSQQRIEEAEQLVASLQV